MTEPGTRRSALRSRSVRVVAGLLIAAVVAACGASSADGSTSQVDATSVVPSTTLPSTTAPPATPATTVEVVEVEDGCAHVVAVDVSAGGQGYTFAVTVSSSETGWDKYADAWVVKGTDGTVYGERVLAHPHVNEQPFTRSLSGVEIPSDTTEVAVAARDSVLGFCGDEVTVNLEDVG